METNVCDGFGRADEHNTDDGEKMARMSIYGRAHHFHVVLGVASFFLNVPVNKRERESVVSSATSLC